MTALRIYDVSAATPSKLRIYAVSGTGSGSAVQKLRIYAVSGSGATAPTLSSDRALYDPGDLVTVTPQNTAGPHTYTFPGGVPAGVAVNASGVLTFPAPATKDGVSIVVVYQGLAYLTVVVSQAFVLVGPTEIPAIVWVEAP